MQNRIATCSCQIPKQNSFEIIKRVIEVFEGIDYVQNVPEDFFGPVGKGVGIFKFLSFDPIRGELCLNEAEPDCWFLLIAGTQFHLGRCDCRGEILTDLLSHGGR